MELGGRARGREERLRVVWGRKQSEMKELERDRTEEMRNGLARKVRHPMQISPAAEFSRLVIWKRGGHDFDMSFFRSMGRLRAVKEIVLNWEHKYYGISQSTDRGGDMGGRHPHTRTISNKMYNQHKKHAALACPPPS